MRVLITEDFKAMLIEYAISKEPEEACGIVVKTSDGLSFFPCTNYAEDKLNEFAISASAYAQVEALGEIIYIFHSHTHSNSINQKLYFSEADRQVCKATNIPWLLLPLPNTNLLELYPDDLETVPLLGRAWSWGVLDCYGLVRDAFKEIGIHLNDYERPLLVDASGLYPWQRDANWSPYETYFAQEGFIIAERELQKYDVFLFNLESSFNLPNHAGILMDVESLHFYHHMLYRYSEKSVYGAPWRKMTCKVLRHHSLD